MNTEIHNSHEELNEISEEEFELYENELDGDELDLEEELEEELEEAWGDFDDGFAALAALRQAVRDLSEQTTDACNTEAETVSYIPSISDFNHPFNYALRWGYDDGMSIQSVQLGPQLLVRTAPQQTKPLPVNEAPFTEFWLDAFVSDDVDDADLGSLGANYKPSPALQKIKAFLDEHEGDYDPIPEALVLQAHAENPDAITKPFGEFAPYGGYANSKTPAALRLSLKLVAVIPETIKTLSTVLEHAVVQVENSYARMSPSMSSSPHLGEPTLASSQTADRGVKTLSGIASLPTNNTAPQRQNA